MSLFRRGPAERRQRALRRASPGPLADFLRTPEPEPDTPLTDLPLLALDLETTGLDPARDRVLSVGWVPVDGRRIVLGGARRAIVSDAGDVGTSATVHGLTDDHLTTGVTLAEVVTELLGALAGRVLLAHFARIETEFVGAACERLWGAGMPCAVVDTLDLERRGRSGVWGPEPEAGTLRLDAARARYGLPRYRAHEALTDALACGELYLAQTAELAARSPKTTQTLRQVLA